MAWIADASGKPLRSVVLVGRNKKEAEARARAIVGRLAGAWEIARLNFGFLVFVEFLGIAKPQNLTTGVPGEYAVRALRLE